MFKQPFFGRRLKELRLERGLSQAALVGEEMSAAYLSRLESGARPPTERAVKYLAGRLGIQVAEFGTAQTPSLAQVLASVTSSSGDDPAEQLITALRTDDRSDPAERWQALWLLATIRRTEGRHEQEHELLLELVTLVDEHVLPKELRARVFTQLSACVRTLGDNAKACEYATEAIELTTELGARDRESALHAVISAEAEANRLLEARAHADELCELTEKMGGAAQTKALWASATVRIRQGAYAEARTALDQALETVDSHEDLVLWMRLRLAAASIYLQIDPPQTAEAQTRLDEIEPVLNLVGTELHRQESLLLRAQLAFEEGDYDNAREFCAAVDPEMIPRLSFRERIRLQVVQSRLQILDGETEAGVQALQDLANQTSNAELAAQIWRGLAQTLADLHAGRGASAGG